MYALTQDIGVLDAELATTGRVTEFLDTLHQLSFHGTDQQVSKATSPNIASSPFGDLGHFETDSNFEKYAYSNDALEWLQRYQKQSSTPSKSSVYSSGILSSSVASSASLTRPPPTPSPISQYPPSYSSRCRTTDV